MIRPAPRPAPDSPPPGYIVSQRPSQADGLWGFVARHCHSDWHSCHHTDSRDAVSAAWDHHERWAPPASAAAQPTPGLPDLSSLATPAPADEQQTLAGALTAIRVLTEQLVRLEDELDRMTEQATECDRRAARMHRRAQRAEGVVRHVRDGLAADIRTFHSPRSHDQYVAFRRAQLHHTRLVDRLTTADRRTREESGR